MPEWSFVFFEVSYLPRQGGDLYTGKNFIKFKKRSNNYLVVIMGGGLGCFMLFHCGKINQLGNSPY